MSDLPFQNILYQQEGPIARITINRPERLNAVDNQTSRELHAAFLDFKRNDALRVAILTGAGAHAFCVGADIQAQQKRGERPWAGDIPFGGITKIEPIYKPIIAAVNGYALGGGLELVLCCDLRLASPNARFGVPEVTIGVIPGAGGTQRLPRAVPPAIATEMVLTGQPIDAETALRLGLINRIVPAEELLDAATALAATIAKLPLLAVRAGKEAILRGLEMPLAQGLALEDQFENWLMKTEDFLEGITAFVEKRLPEFKGR